MVQPLADDARELILSAAKKLTGYKRRAFQAEAVLKYAHGSPRAGEARFGWGREAINTGLNERRSGVRCIDNVAAKGKVRIEVIHPQLAQDIRAIADPQSQADPKFQTALAFTRLTAKAVCDQLRQNGSDLVPSERSMHRILNRMGYRTQSVRKTQPKKKSPRPTRSSRT